MVRYPLVLNTPGRGGKNGRPKIASRVLKEFMTMRSTGVSAISAYPMRTAWMPIVLLPEDATRSPEELRRVRGVGAKGMVAALEDVGLHPSLPREEIEEHAHENEHKHRSGDRGAHHGIAQLELMSEERSVEERAQDIRGKIRSGEGSFDRVNEVEGVKVAHIRQNRDQAHDG